jgi:hypothetical protein
VRFFQPVYSVYEYYEINITSKSFAQKFEKFALTWFSVFRGEDLNVIFNQNMPNLHNRYKSAERKISNKNPEHMLNYSLPCSCS